MEEISVKSWGPCILWLLWGQELFLLPLGVGIAYHKADLWTQTVCKLNLEPGACAQTTASSRPSLELVCVFPPPSLPSSCQRRTAHSFSRASASGSTLQRLFRRATSFLYPFSSEPQGAGLLCLWLPCPSWQQSPACGLTVDWPPSAHGLPPAQSVLAQVRSWWRDRAHSCRPHWFLPSSLFLSSLLLPRETGNN